MKDIRYTGPGDFVFSYRAVGILIREGHILLQKTRGENEYFLPGGHVQQLERSAEALRRECREELRSEIEILSFAGTGELFFPWEGNCIHQLCIYYRICLQGTPGIPLSGTFAGFDREETERFRLEYVWLPLTSLPEIHLLPEESRPLLKDGPPVLFTGVQD